MSYRESLGIIQGHVGITDKKMEPYCSFSLSSPACGSISLPMTTKSKTENGLGFRVEGLGFRGLEFRVLGLSKDLPAWESINIMPLDSRLPRGIPHDPSCNSIQVLGAPIAKLDPPHMLLSMATPTHTQGNHRNDA